MALRGGAEMSALPLVMRDPVPSVARVLGAAPEVKLAALGGTRSIRQAAAQDRVDRLSPLALTLSVFALAGLGSARRQAVYRWMVRR
ncbi:hypothetical protein [Jannaschia seohaensis]|uniref:Uncharacterized protein n=1 Tax=Jannaschia seohaensis TaxID=475081 RepID=A0A2Y9C194_9RHOB|nr:hypothetical protein [Jannaschia seohaensis]PWJ17473.1 hypothetical protein BCF38_10683 [Jannaschia seohaensis]SSA47552.1 hypothetical protein SAMN05421539_10683 [Jannaschia seohaensis]